MKKTLLPSVILLLLCLLCACSAMPQEETLSAYSADTITITGLAEEEFTLTVADLAKLDLVERGASAQRSNGQKVSVDAVGPLLDTLLAQYGKSQSDFSRVRFSANDGYSIAVAEDILDSREIVLALADGDQALPEEDQPVRVVIPGERAMYWLRQLNRIEFESGEASVPCVRMVFLSAAVQTLDSEDYLYNGVTDQAVAVNSLLDAYAGGNSATAVRLTAADGLVKTETVDNFRSGLLKYTGADAPRFVSEQLPEGMEIYDLTVIAYGGTSFLTLDKLISLYGDGQDIDFFRLAAVAEGGSAEKYDLRCLDGTVTTLDVDELTGAMVSLDASGRVVLTPANGQPVLDLLQIEVAQ